jgi:hypothetical protein
MRGARTHLVVYNGVWVEDLAGERRPTVEEPADIGEVEAQGNIVPAVTGAWQQIRNGSRRPGNQCSDTHTHKREEKKSSAISLRRFAHARTRPPVPRSPSPVPVRPPVHSQFCLSCLHSVSGVLVLPTPRPAAAVCSLHKARSAPTTRACTHGFGPPRTQPRLHVSFTSRRSSSTVLMLRTQNGPVGQAGYLHGQTGWVGGASVHTWRGRWGGNGEGRIRRRAVPRPRRPAGMAQHHKRTHGGIINTGWVGAHCTHCVMSCSASS